MRFSCVTFFTLARFLAIIVEIIGRFDVFIRERVLGSVLSQ